MKTELLVSAINAAILSAIEVHTATLHAPTFNGKELTYLQECIESTYVSSVGAMVTDFDCWHTEAILNTMLSNWRILSFRFSSFGVVNLTASNLTC